MRNLFQKLGFGIIVLLLLILSCSISIAAKSDDSPVLRVAFPESTGINEVYEDGTYGGCTYDWLYEIAKYTGWKYEFVTGDPSELVNDMIAGEYDLMGGMFYSEEYKNMFQYPEYIMGANYSLLIYSQNDRTIKSFDYNTLNGKRIGVYQKAKKKIERLQKFLNFNNLECELVYFDDLPEYESCMETGKVDLLYGSDVYMKENYNVAAKIEGDPYYIVTSINEPELCIQLSEAMDAIYSANPNFGVELYEKYFPETYINSINFTEKEQTFIAESSPIRVAVFNDQYPLFYKEDNVIKGIVPACLNLISKRTGLSFEYAYADSYQEQLTLVQDGNADIVGSFLNKDHSADILGLVRTANFAFLDTIILRNKWVEISADGLIMAVPQGRDLSPSNSTDTIMYYKNYRECLKAVDRGEADYTQMPATLVEELYTRDYYTNITLIVDIDQAEEVTFALSQPVNVTLYSILNKAINNLSEDELNSIISQQFLTSRAGIVTFKTFLYTNPLLAIVLCVGFVMLVSIIILLLGHYKMKGRVMQLKLEKAEETSHAKSDFLSRISHEIRTPMNAIIGLTNLSLLNREASPAIKENLSKIDASSKFLLSLLNDVLDMSKIESQKMKLKITPFDLNIVIKQLKNMFTIQAEQKQIKLIFQSELKSWYYLGDKMRLSQVLTNLFSNACKFTEDGGCITLSIIEKERNSDYVQMLFSVKDTGIGINPEDLERIFQSFEQAESRKQGVPGTGLGLAISQSLVQLMGGELRVKSTIGIGSEFFFTIQLPIFHEEINPKPETSVQNSDSISLVGMRVLLAEDNDINAEIAIELLKLQQIEVERAVDGQRAVEMFSSHLKGYYDLILMDVNMPVKDGLTATTEIRAMERSDAKTIPILAMTANTFQDDREKALAAGMSDFLPKPFDVEQLYNALRKSFSHNPEL